MKVDDVPCSFAHCYATEEQCGKRQRCLRHHAARMNEEDLAKPKEILMCITQDYVNRVAKGEDCIHFRSDTPLRYARGMKVLFDDVPKSQYAAIRQRVISCFSCRRIFFYAKKGEQLISPAEQAHIEYVFKSAGMPAPRFDRYELFPEWRL